MPESTMGAQEKEHVFLLCAVRAVARVEYRHPLWTARHFPGSLPRCEQTEGN